MQLVVLSFEPWDNVGRRIQLMIDTLLACRCDLHILFVEPPAPAGRLVQRDRWTRDDACFRPDYLPEVRMPSTSAQCTMSASTCRYRAALLTSSPMLSSFTSARIRCRQDQTRSFSNDQLAPTRAGQLRRPLELPAR
jgi:hypothetical protein